MDMDNILCWISLFLLFIVLAKLHSIEQRLDGLKPPAAPPAAPPPPPRAAPAPAVRPAEVAPPPCPPPPDPTPLPCPVKVSHLQVDLDLESRTAEVLRKIKNWLVAGDESGDPGVTREYAVVTTWLVRLGVLVLIAGAGFFLKYSIDHNWMKPAVRVTLMAAAGAALCAGGIMKSRSQYRLPAIALAGLGFVVLQLSVLAAYRLYHLLPALPAFILLAAITAAAMAAALGMDALLPAVIGCVGGFLAPVLIRTPEPDAVKLFVYMTILNAGVLFGSGYRNWVLLHLLSLFFYAVLGTVALDKMVTGTNAPLLLVLLTVNYTLFSLLPLLVARRRDATLLELALMVGNAAFYFLAAIPIADKYYPAWKVAAAVPLFAALLAGAQLYLCRRERPVLRMFLATLTAFGAALVVPLALTGVWITAAWSVLAYLLFTLAVRNRAKHLLALALLLYLVTFFMACGNLLDDRGGYLAGLGRHLAGAGVFFAALGGAAWRSSRRRTLEWFAAAWGKSPTLPAWIFAAEAAAGFFWLTSLELDRGLKLALPGFRNGGVTIWWCFVACALLFAGIRRRLKPPRLAGAILLVVCAVKIFLVDLAGLEQLWRIAAFAVTGILILLGAVLYIRFRQLFTVGGHE